MKALLLEGPSDPRIEEIDREDDRIIVNDVVDFDVSVIAPGRLPHPNDYNSESEYSFMEYRYGIPVYRIVRPVRNGFARG